MIIRTALITVLLAAPVFAAAQDHGKGHAGHGSHATRAQSTTPASPLDFDRLDTDRDGFIRASDLPAGHPALDHFGMADRNSDLRLDRAEFEILLKML